MNHQEDNRRYYEETLEKIDALIADNSGDEACEAYLQLTQKIEEETSEDNSALKARSFFGFATFLLKIQEFPACLAMIIKAQAYGHLQDDITNFTEHAFIEPNLDFFQQQYAHNVTLLHNSCHFSLPSELSALRYSPLPTLQDNTFYLLDRKTKKIVEGTYTDNNPEKRMRRETHSEFADFLLADNWRIDHLQPYINTAQGDGKQCYILLRDKEKFLASLQLVQLSLNSTAGIHFFSHRNEFTKYFRNSSSYLPRNIIDFSGRMPELKTILHELHQYRLTREGRKGNNILLSICIPSYNRGHRALDNITHCLSSYYDEEIEFILSNNGSENETTPSYETIKNIDDARLCYHRFDENKGFAINLCKVCELASGRFVLLLSDEDLVNFTRLHLFMNILHKEKETLSELRTSLVRQGRVTATPVLKKGKEALLSFMISSNYFSGLFFNNEILKKNNVFTFIKENLDSSICLYYPHLYFELIACQHGNVQAIDMVLVKEGKAEETAFFKTDIGKTKKLTIPGYATLESRLQQHEDFFLIFKDLEICSNNKEILREMYCRLCNKTFYLLNVSINVYYRKIDANLLELHSKTHAHCLRYLEQIHTAPDGQDKEPFLADKQRIDSAARHFLKTL